MTNNAIFNSSSTQVQLKQLKHRGVLFSQRIIIYLLHIILNVKKKYDSIIATIPHP
jgi:hypothetical protein